jgi:hypothetical protein
MLYDDMPKEGELLDISKNKSNQGGQRETFKDSSSQTKMPIGLIVGLVGLAVVAFLAKGLLGGPSEDKIALYQQDIEQVFSSMKTQYPNLVSITCEGAKPNKLDCVNFVGTFRPDKDSPAYQMTMDTADKVSGVTPADIESIRGSVKVLANSKRTILQSSGLFSFRIDSVTIPKVGEEYTVKTKCIESGADDVVCSPVR